MATLVLPERVVETDAHEGPVYVMQEDALYFTTVPEWRDGAPETRIMRFALATGELAVVRRAANMANGMALGHDGRLVVCEQGLMTRAARISRVDRRTGAAETVVAAWYARRLSSPNDVVVKSDGSIWFTDPSYGHLQGFRPPPQAGEHVYRFDPDTGVLSVAADGFDKPNGLAFSPEEDVLYVGDNGAPQELLAFDVSDGRRLVNRRRFAPGTPGHPDGLKVDGGGRVYASSDRGVQVYSPDGDPLAEIELPGAVNFCFGRDGLFITADTAIWFVSLPLRGA